MSRSKGRKAPSSASSAGGRRAQTIGLFVLFAVLAVLIGSMSAGLFGGRDAREEVVAEVEDARSRDVPRPAERVRVEVLNASGVPGLARRGTEMLRDGGFDVVSYGNGQGYAPDSSLVMDRVGRMELARSVADAMDVPRVYARPDSNVYVDVTVVLGRDWAAENSEDVSAEP